MIFAPAQKLSGINSNVDIKAKLTPSDGQVESDAVTALRVNASEFMSFGHSIPIYSHFKTNFTALKRLFHAGAHANHVELFPAASRCMISCLAAVGCFHDLLIMIDDRPVTRILCGGVLTRPKRTQLRKCIFIV